MEPFLSELSVFENLPAPPPLTDIGRGFTKMFILVPLPFDLNMSAFWRAGCFVKYPFNLALMGQISPTLLPLKVMSVASASPAFATWMDVDLLGSEGLEWLLVKLPLPHRFIPATVEFLNLRLLARWSWKHAVIFTLRNARFSIDDHVLHQVQSTWRSSPKILCSKGLWEAYLGRTDMIRIYSIIFTHTTLPNANDDLSRVAFR